ncbi:MAG: FAD-dependent monooxygenase [Hyphomicrobiaceae bacterium]
MEQKRVIVVGGGPAGLLAGLALAKEGVETTLITPAPPPPGTAGEARTAALFAPSLAFLRYAGVFDAIKAASAPMRGIRVTDDRGGLLRAPEVAFFASEIGLESFGYNVPNRALNDALRAALRGAGSNLTWLEGVSVTAMIPEANRATVVLSDGRRISGSLVAGADGRKSVCRAGAGIGVDSHEYDQVAITANFRHQRPHEGISTELHGPAGPCTTVPLPGRASSLVWIERRSIGARLMALEHAAFVAALEARLKGLLGGVSDLVIQGQFPLSWMKAKTFAARRVMLVSEAAHVMPPIGAQGLNLGLRDVGHLVECISDAVRSGRDPGGDGTLAAYNTARKGDVETRMSAVDALNRSLLSDLVPVHLARGIGLHLLSAFGPLRRAVIAQGMSPSALPRMMRTPQPL